MYSITYIMFEEAGVIITLDCQVSCNKEGIAVTREEESFGLTSEYEYTHPDYVLFLMKLGTIQT